MRRTLIALFASTLVLSACGRTSQPVATQGPETTNPLIPQGGGLFGSRRVEEVVYLGTPLERVTGLVAERVPGGVIVRATGVARLQGVHSVQLTPATEGEAPVDGVLTYRLEGIKPEGSQVQGSEATREVTAARALTRQQLSAVRTIRVVGVTNAMVVRR